MEGGRTLVSCPSETFIVGGVYIGNCLLTLLADPWIFSKAGSRYLSKKK